MNCSEVQASLSPYYDGELPEETRVQVSSHLDECSGCAETLAGFDRLSMMAGAQDTPDPPPQMWTQIEKRLGESTLPTVVGQAKRVSHEAAWSIPKYLVMAATVLIAVGLIAFRPWFGNPGNDEFAAEFGHHALLHLRANRVSAE